MNHNLLSLTIGNQDVIAPSGIPTGGLGKLTSILNVAITLFMIGGTILALFVLIWGGFQWMTSGGDAKVVETARRKITFSIIGLIIIFLSFLFISILGHFFDISFFDVGAPNLPGPCSGTAC